MTDKLIIHGVDVSRCEFFFRDNINGIFTQELCACMEEHTGTNSYKSQCLENPACYFKQSARKDERIKSLQGELWAEKKILTELDQENAELKEHNSESWKNVASTYKVEYRKAEEKLSQIAELAENIENIYEVLKDMDFEKRCRFFIARTSSNTKYDLWEFKNFIFSFIQPFYELHVKHLQQIKQIAGDK